MQNASDLKTQLQAIHRRSYPAYKSLKGSYQFRDFILHIDHVQGVLLHHLHISVSVSVTKPQAFQPLIIKIHLRV